MIRPRRSYDSLAFVKPLSFMDSDNHDKPLKIGEYILLQKIGSGSTSKVFVSFNLKTKEYFAVKVINISKKNLPQINHEIHLMNVLKHCNIINLKEVLFSKEKSKIFLVMDYSEFGSLSNYLEKGVKFNIEIIGSIFKQIIEALSYIHSQKYTHQDIKPRNILLFSDGVAKITDFGISHSFQSLDMMNAGTPAYQAPETFDALDSFDEEDENFAENLIDPIKSDVYSLGVSLFECITNRKPYEGDSLFEIAREMRNNREIVFPPEIEITNDLQDLIKKMLELDPKKRISLNEVLNSQYFSNIDKIIPFELEKPKLPEFDPNSPFVEIKVEKYGPNSILNSSSPLLYSLSDNSLPKICSNESGF
ncbi:CAMK family protein kinase [Tritrichomonas foetus]|uniref:CAMK family protein kinase n=1 Tax=Tritrichomonas foetus TaxID=1144522 RepID=A0A1J4JLR9_9EUKA|nr:CAMK family protein kinase [Tritrichomonas foetus]|eukprot:OHS98485.1 CAMK family protein kinase [Tritrichomonas foetus]